MAVTVGDKHEERSSRGALCGERAWHSSGWRAEACGIRVTRVAGQFIPHTSEYPIGCSFLAGSVVTALMLDAIMSRMTSILCSCGI